MKYRAVLPKKNSNVSPGHPLREFVMLVAMVALLLALVYMTLGLFIDRAVDYIAPETEIAIYRSINVDQWAEFGEPVAGDETEQAIQALLVELSRCIDIGYPVKLRIKKSEQANAFALPGGHIVLLSGLLDKVDSQNGLAFVLAHELAHFKNRDHLRSLGRSVVLMALAVAFTGANSSLSQIIAPFSNLEAAQFSQERESAADDSALEILNCHYGHVGGATEFFKAVADTAQGVPLTHYFESHPQAQQRIADINSLTQSRGYRIGQTISKQQGLKIAD